MCYLPDSVEFLIKLHFKKQLLLLKINHLGKPGVRSQMDPSWNNQLVLSQLCGLRQVTSPLSLSFLLCTTGLFIVPPRGAVVLIGRAHLLSAWHREVLSVPSLPCCHYGCHGDDFEAENTDLFPVLGGTFKAPVLPEL